MIILLQLFLVQKTIGTNFFLLVCNVSFGDLSIKVFHTVHAADHPRLFGKGLDQQQAIHAACVFRDLMQGKAPQEELQVPGVQLQLLHSAAVTSQHLLDLFDALVLGSAQVGNILEHPSGFRRLQKHGDGELVGVEVSAVMKPFVRSKKIFCGWSSGSSGLPSPR